MILLKKYPESRIRAAFYTSPAKASATLLLCGGLVFSASSVHAAAPAQMPDPFASVQGEWSTVSDYSKNIAAKPAATQAADSSAAPVVPAMPAPTTISSPLPPVAVPSIAATTDAASAPTAAPTATAEKPVAKTQASDKGANFGYDMRIGATVEESRNDNYVPPANNSAAVNTASINEPKPEGWRDLSQANQKKNETNSKKAEQPNIRWAVLPGRYTASTAISATPGNSIESHRVAVKAAPVLPSFSKEKDQANKTADLAATSKPAPNTAACAAISSYKRKQLAAIQSDQQTLAALQAAVAELGLNSKLNFADGGDGAARTENTGGGMDFPPQKKITAKN